MSTVFHASDCALHNGPAEMPEPCSCGAEPGRVPDLTTSDWPGEFLDEVLACLPADYQPISEIALPTQPHYALFSALHILRREGRADLVYGRGWKRVA